VFGLSADVNMSSSPEVAEYLLSISLEQSDRDRMEQLAEHSGSVTLTAEEQAEFDSYLHIGNLLAVMQSMARVALRRNSRNGPDM
jgi:hypothetical protein